jgi:homogentisate 1,2-dioxygenase
MSSRRPSLPRSEGVVAKQAHVDLPGATYEREIGRDGFFGAAAHMYHRHPPTGWTQFEGPLRPRAFDTSGLDFAANHPWDATPLLGNAHVRMSLWKCPASMRQLARNSDGDQLLFVHAGSGDLFCDYGHLAFSEGDYLVLPRGTMWRIEVSEPVAALAIEATDGSFGLPERGLLGAHAIFDPGVLETPTIDERFRAQQDEREWQVVVKARGARSTITYPFNPLDAVGWKGDLAPLRLNWRDIRPVVSARYHLPPSAHTTFVAPRCVVCTFCPRPIESDPGALKVPFYHSNDDFDEVIFYHRGNFFSRDDIAPGMLTLHPRGFTHGPHPKALAASRSAPRTHTDEVAVMLDTRDPLEIAPEASALERPDYVHSWRAR